MRPLYYCQTSLVCLIPLLCNPLSLVAAAPQPQQPDNNDNKAQSKRGVAYQGDKHKADNRLLFSPESPVDWYYTWSLWPAPEAGDGVEFLPLVHSTDDLSSRSKADAFRKQLDGLPRSSTHLLTFNEPDGDTGSGGSAIEPKDAARAYIDHIAPLRSSSGDGGRTWNISHPSVTGSPRGLDWLRRFNESCWDLDREKGCPTDFVAVHWYGAFEGLSGWLDTLHSFYNNNNTSSSKEDSKDKDKQLKFWITEMALPQQDDKATLSMMNQTLPYLDKLDYVAGYAWFGAFRKGEKANQWTGDQVSLFNDDGGLTELGSLYLSSGNGGDNKDGGGFEPGKKGPPGKDDDEGAAAGIRPKSRWVAVLTGVAVAASLVAW
ncbi:Alkali-sensitive linkage protein 1 [Apiospora arundinis]|uniref:Alkali-sensitive linkage protein 1 n=1 Tax=Apiospora arundinis TaxID=335852 RepID=A0ABR2I0D8_9PEZI